MGVGGGGGGGVGVGWGLGRELAVSPTGETKISVLYFNMQVAIVLPPNYTSCSTNTQIILPQIQYAALMPLKT